MTDIPCLYSSITSGPLWPLVSCAILVILGVSIVSTTAPVSLVDDMSDWDDATGLWVTGRDAGRPVRSIRGNAWRLVAGGLSGGLDLVPVDRVLDALRAAQQRDGETRGNFWWNWEDGRVTDRNSAFFTGLGLLVLRCEYGERLTPGQRDKLDAIFEDLEHWFRRETVPLRESLQRYPNKFIGDLVCAWLLAEWRDDVGPDLETLMRDGLAYYRKSHWGWGEHLSDLYSKVCHYELLALLIYGRRLPAATREMAARLIEDLLLIDAQFAGGPRVPTIRCYSLDESPGAADALAPHFHPLVAGFKPWTGLRTAVAVQGPGLMSFLAYRHGLHERFKMPARKGGRLVEVAAYGDARALATVTERWRLGVMTRYPMAIDSNLREWGLHWQSMPVAFWHTAGDWGYLQWVTSGDGASRALPAFSMTARQSCVLSDQTAGAAVGLTFGRRYGEGFVVLRRLPGMAPEWSRVEDRFRILHCTADLAVDVAGGWQRCLASFGREILTLGYYPLDAQADMRLERTDDRQAVWTAGYDLAGRDTTNVSGIWFMAVDGAPVTLPPVARHGRMVVVGGGGNPTVTFETEVTV